jgi:hypothetical protein
VETVYLELEMYWEERYTWSGNGLEDWLMAFSLTFFVAALLKVSFF